MPSLLKKIYPSIKKKAALVVYLTYFIKVKKVNSVEGVYVILILNADMRIQRIILNSIVVVISAIINISKPLLKMILI